MKLGILGGTFNPIHFGHLRTAEEIGEALDLEKVFLIPSASPPHKTGGPVAPFHHRLTMARLAVKASPQLDVLDLEGKRRGLSYSIETLREFHEMFRPDPELFFIIGTDAFAEINTWKEYQDLFRYAHFVIVHRAGYTGDGLETLFSNLGIGIKKTRIPHVFRAPSGKTFIAMTPTLMDISSTHIREKVAEGKSIRFLVPESVRSYLTEKGLFDHHASH